MCQGKEHFFLSRLEFLRRVGHKAKQNGLQLESAVFTCPIISFSWTKGSGLAILPPTAILGATNFPTPLPRRCTNSWKLQVVTVLLKHSEGLHTHTHPPHTLTVLCVMSLPLTSSKNGLFEGTCLYEFSEEIILFLMFNAWTKRRGGETDWYWQNSLFLRTLITSHSHPMPPHPQAPASHSKLVDQGLG